MSLLRQDGESIQGSLGNRNVVALVKSSSRRIQKAFLDFAGSPMFVADHSGLYVHMCHLDARIQCALNEAISCLPFEIEIAEFPGGPVVRTRRFHCRGPGAIPGQGTKILEAATHGHKIKIKIK